MLGRVGLGDRGGMRAAVEVGCQGRSEVGQGHAEVVGNRLRGEFQDLCDFLMRQVVVPYEEEHVAASLGKGIHRGRNTAA